jgi:hypothetical protein
MLGVIAAGEQIRTTLFADEGSKGCCLALTEMFVRGYIVVVEAAEHG